MIIHLAVLGIFLCDSEKIKQAFAIYANLKRIWLLGLAVLINGAHLEPSPFVLRGQDAMLFALLREFKQKVVYKFISCSFQAVFDRPWTIDMKFRNK